MRLLTFRLLITSALFLPAILCAQISSGTIDYNESRTFEVWEGASIDTKKRIKEAQERGDFDSPGRVTFTTEAFSYGSLPKPKSTGQGRRNWWMSQEDNPDVYYTSIQDSLVTDYRRIMDRSFIMEDAWVAPDWEIPANQRPNMAYTLPSEVAYATSIEGDTLTAYFTRTIPIGVGPRGYGGLPGAIVYLKVQNEGSFTEYTMTTMNPNPEELTLERPTEGDKISREKFEKIRAKREEAMERRRRGWERN